MTDPDRIAEGAAMLMAGIRRRHDMKTAGQTIGAQWSDFMAGEPLPNRTGDAVYGIMCQSDMGAGTFEYMTAVEVSSFPREGVADPLEIPAQPYAVFVHGGHVSQIGDSWQNAFGWAKQSDYEHAAAPPFERYGPGYDVEKGKGDIELWIPVRPKAS